MAKYDTHDFYCLNCGHKGIPISRKRGQQRGQFHRKKLYCIYCATECNHMEIRNQEEKEIFMEAYNNGEYREEAANSIRACGSAGVR